MARALRSPGIAAEPAKQSARFSAIVPFVDGKHVRRALWTALRSAASSASACQASMIFHNDIATEAITYPRSSTINMLKGETMGKNWVLAPNRLGAYGRWGDEDLRSVFDSRPQVDAVIEGLRAEKVHA